MITYVGRSNHHCFAPFLPPDIAALPEKGSVLIFGALAGERPCGAGAVEIHAGFACLLSLYIAPDFRGQGQGLALLQRIIEEAEFCDAQSIQAILAEKDELTQDLAALLEKAGFRRREEQACPFYTAKLQEVFQAALLQKTGALPREIVAMDQLAPAILREFNLRQAANENYPFDPIDIRQVEPSISMALLREGAMVGGIWFSHDETGLTVDGLYLENNQSLKLLQLIQAAARAGLNRYPSETRINIAAIHEVTRRLVTKVMADVPFQAATLVAMERQL